MSRIVSPSGSAFSQVMVLGLRPGKAEYAANKPFVGRTGTLVTDITSSLLHRVYLTNLLPDPFKPTTLDSLNKHSTLKQDLNRVGPKVVVTLGEKVTSFVLRDRSSIMLMHGLLIPLENYIVLPVFDPGYVLRSGGLASRVGEEWISDWEELRTVSGLRDLKAYSKS